MSLSDEELERYARHIVLRQVDGAEILRRIDEHGVTLLCAAPAVVSAALDAAKSWDGPVPGRDRVRIIVAGAPPPTSTIEEVMTVLGWEFIQIYGLTETAPLLTINRSRAEWDELDLAVPQQLVDRGLVHPRHRRDRAADPLALHHEQRQDQVLWPHLGLADQGAQGLGTAQPARAVGRELWHHPSMSSRRNRFRGHPSRKSTAFRAFAESCP